MGTQVSCLVDGAVAWLLLDGEKQLNAIGTQTYTQLASAMRALEQQDSVRAVVLHGQGRAFCAGADIEEIQSFTGRDDFANFIHGFTDALPNSRAVNLPIQPARLSIALDDLADVGPALVSAAAILSHEVGQAFGVTELPQLTRDGRIQPQYWSTSGQLPQLRRWAEERGIIVGSTTVSS